MPSPLANVVCTACRQNFTAVPKKSFLGFQKFVCPACTKDVEYPLTSGYRVAYWFFFALMALTIFNEGLQGNIGLAVVLGIGCAVALIRDRTVKNRIRRFSNETAPVSGG